jgi:transposase
MQPEKTSNKKTDRRDANNLCELLWNNNRRIKNGERPNGIRRVVWPTPEDADVRQLASLRRHLVCQRSKCIIKIRGCLRKHNLEQDCPTKQYTTKKAGEWLKTLELPPTDRLEIDIHCTVWKTLNTELLKVELELAKRVETNKNVLLLTSIPGITHLGAATLLSRIGNMERFPTPDSLANYFGLTPGCRNSGEKTQQHTPITKAGSSLARSILCTAVNHVVRKDKAMKDWHKGIKKRKGTKTARVAVMRRLATIVWHMVKRQMTYQFHYEPIATSQPKTKSPQKCRVGFPRHDSGVQCTCK